MSNNILTTDPRVTPILRIIILWILKKLKKKDQNLKINGLWAFSPELLSGEKGHIHNFFIY